jgi:hypothetical protein
MDKKERKKYSEEINKLTQELISQGEEVDELIVKGSQKVVSLDFNQGEKALEKVLASLAPFIIGDVKADPTKFVNPPAYLAARAPDSTHVLRLFRHMKVGKQFISQKDFICAIEQVLFF